MTIDVKLEIVDSEIMKFNTSETPLREFQKIHPGTSRSFMIHYMEKYNMVWCKTFNNFLNIGPLIKNQIK